MSELLRVLEAYKNVGVIELADYQRDILNDRKFYPPESSNLLLSAPTGCGKNVVIEILATTNVLNTAKKCIFILPYIAAAQETFFKLQQVWREFGLVVKAHFGTISVSSNEEFDGIVCTIEKSAAFVNRLIREDSLKDFCSIIFDEIHMLLDTERGGILEDLLIKLKYYKSIGKETPQILSMSATLENPNQICTFIDACYVEYSNRLNRLDEFGVVNKKFFQIGGTEPIGLLNPLFDIASDTMAVIGLTVEALIEQKPVLIFCMTKVCAEQTASLISSYIKFCNSKPNSRFSQLRDLGIKSEEGVEKIMHLLKTGVAYHHSGLSSEDRSIVERLYRQGEIKVIACTSTLSTGVNLPATRVLIRLDQGPLNINFVSYNQMIGRCGRIGYGNGQSFIIAQNAQKLSEIWRLIRKRPFTQISRDFTQLILDALVSKLVKDEEECEKLLSFTIQKSLNNARDIVCYLIEKKFVYTLKTNDNRIRLIPNQLATAASQSFLRPNDALFIFTELEKATKNLCLDTELHLAYLITPLKHKLGIDVTKISWDKFFDLFDKLPADYLRVADFLGISHSTCIDALNGPPKDTLVRFYLALILMEALEGISIKQILYKYNFRMADLEVLRDQAVLYARTVVGMCDCLAWPYMKNVLGLFTKKLELWAYPEICDLMKIKGMDGTRARHFIERGITTLQELAISDLSNVENILRHAVPFVIDSTNNGDQNEWLINERTNSCNEAAKLLIERAQKLTPIIQEILKDESMLVEKSCVLEESISQFERNIILDVTMESLADMTAELSIIEFENDENKKPEKTNCLNEFLSNSNFVVFELIKNEFLLISDSKKRFNVPLLPTSTCLKECCVSDEMLRAFLTNEKVPKYAYNLSLTFFKAFNALSGRVELNSNTLKNFYCILSLFRVRLKKGPQTVEVLDAEVRKLALSCTSEQTDKETLFLTSLLILIEKVLMRSDYLKPYNQLVQHFNDSVLTSIAMSYRGFFFDKRQYQKLITSIPRQIVVAETKAWEIAGEKFNLHNCKSTRQILTKFGVPSTGKQTTTIAELGQIKHPIATFIIQARKLSHANKVLRDIEALVHTDGRIHPYYNCLNSCTGRIFAEEPPIQFVPKERYLNGESCRSVFSAAEGNTLLSLDFKQVELRMLAALSNDTNLCEMIRKDLDPFEHVMPNRNFSRDIKKRIFYALLYGMGKKTLAQELNLTLEEADRIISEMFQHFKGVRLWIEDVVAKTVREGFVQSMWNLSISMSNLNEFEIRQKAPHFIIQASVSELIRKIMNQVGDKINLVLQMHDEFILEVSKEHADEIAGDVNKMMEFEVNGIAFPVKSRKGDNWDVLE